MVGDCSGYDIGGQSATPEECAAACSSTAGCAGWVYAVPGTFGLTKYPCWLKYVMCEEPAPVKGINVTSHFKTQADNGMAVFFP